MEFIKARKTKRKPALLTLHYLCPVLFVCQIHMQLAPCTNFMWVNLDWAIIYAVIQLISHFSPLPRLDAVNFSYILAFGLVFLHNLGSLVFHSCAVWSSNSTLANICVGQSKLDPPDYEIHSDQELLA